MRTSNFEKGITRFSQFILKLVAITLVVMVVLHLFIKPGETPFLELVLFAVALAVSVIPEALPVVMTVCLSKGARRLAEHRVVVKRLSAIEDLGSIEVLCTDKTGTLTKNVLTVAEIYGKDRTRCLQTATLASAVIGDRPREANNSFDIAVWRALNDAQRATLRQAKRHAEIPFDPERRRNSVLVSYEGVTQLVVRGAPERILPQTHLDPTEEKTIQAWLINQGTLVRSV